jgi:hypothetical protein
VLALDTEFMRVRTFHAQAALFQLFDGEQCHLVDPLAIEDLSALADVLSDTSVTKIMHSCSEDLEVCARRLGALPDPLIDTQVLAAFCGHGLSIGYQRLVGLELGIELEKSETRTDWLQRLSGVDTCFGPVNTLGEAFADPHLRARDMVVPLQHPQAGEVLHLGVAIKLSETPGRITGFAPWKGQHTKEILTELGYDA